MRVFRSILRALGAICASLVILVLLGFWTINLVNWNKHKGILISAVEKFTDFRIEELEGLRVQIYLHADARYERLKIRSVAKDSAFNSFESREFHVRLPMRDLFRKKIIIETFILEASRLQLKEVSESAQKEEDSEGGMDAMPSLFVNLAALNDAQIRYKALAGEGWKFEIERFFLSSPGSRLPSVISGNGVFNDAPVEVIGQSVSFDDFRDADAIPLWLHASLGVNQFDIRGSVRSSDSSTRFFVEADGPNIEEFKRLLRLNLGPVPAYKLSLVSVTEGKKIDLSKIDLTLGKSRLLGSASLNFRAAKPKIKADLSSPVLAQSDLSPIFKTDARYKDQDEPPKAPGQYFSDKPIETTALKALDLDIRYNVDTYIGEKAGRALHGGHARLVLKNSNLTLDPLVFNTEEGVIAGNFRFDARQKPLAVGIGLRAQRIDLNKLLGPIATEVPVLNLKPNDMARGILTGHLDLQMQGNTPMELAADVKGPIALIVEEGALSGTIIEAFGIDVSETIRTWVQGHPLYPMKCMLTSFEAGNGGIGTKAFLISTKDTSIIGKGGLSLVGNKVDFTLNAHPHDFSIGSLRTPIEIKGPLNDISVGLKKEELGIRGSAAIALGTLVNPLLALLPLTETGLDKKGKCKDIVNELQLAQQRSKTPPAKTVVR